MSQTAFFAYPEAHPHVRDAIRGAAERTLANGVSIRLWENMRILGFKVDDLIRDEIHEAEFLAADITYPNHNVVYELGYAIALGKPILPTLNCAISGATERVRKIGLFDTTGYAKYENAEELATELESWEGTAWINRYGQKRDYAQPLFILDTLKKTDFRNYLFHAADGTSVNYRTFDPAEVPRLTAAQALSEVSASAGVIIPIISEDVIDFELHNLRAAFILGLSHGCDIDALAIQYGGSPAPLDYRDFIRNSTSRFETFRHIEEYCQKTLVLNQRPLRHGKRKPAGILSDIELGSSAAENETQQLSQYFVETAEYSRALRAEGALVIGRKGSGKSAVYSQVVEHHREKGRNRCIVDLRPASHNLSEMREALTSIMAAGVYDHTIAAFWQYLIYMELLLKMREVLLARSKNNYELQAKLSKLEDDFSLTDSIVSGDFTSRLGSAVDQVISQARQATEGSDLRSRLTNIMFEDPIPRIRERIVELSGHFESVELLIDDLDKGWPPRRVEPQDISTVKHLIEMLNRIRRDLTKRDVDFHHLIFLRSDIYEKLVEQTSDRGKYDVITVDWSDSEQLRNLLRVRVEASVERGDEEAAWAALNPVLGSGDAVERMIETSLRRPRFLIDVCERTLSFAINRGHISVEVDDLDDAIAQMSLYLVSDFGYEMRDVAGTPEDIFYRFIGASEKLTEDELVLLLADDELGLGLNETIDLLLWYGFLGVVSNTGRPVFIYDRAYDFRRLEAERRAKKGDVVYAVNPAFLSGLRD